MKAIKEAKKYDPSEVGTQFLVQQFDRLCQLINNNKKELSTLIINEIGKTKRDTTAEIDRAITTIKSVRDARVTLSGDLLESANYVEGENKLGLVRHAPLGIVLAITPFNFPINLALHKIAPALAMGNSVLFKPHPQCYKSSKFLVNLFYEAGFSRNSLKMICPSHETMGEITFLPDIKCISFTGGIIGAKAISKSAVLQKQLFELGGNDALVIFPDADLNKAAETIINQRFGCSGQRCTAPKRIFLHESIYEDTKRILVKKTRDLIVGDPQNSDTFVGPVVSKEAAEKVMKRIASAIKGGAKIITGGQCTGALIQPTIIENLDLEMDLIKEETFGPVVSLLQFSKMDELITQINNTPFGLQCGVFTNNIHNAKAFFAKLNVGTLAINEGPGYRADHFPFGGSKSSGIGREGAKYALLEFSQTKTLII